MKNRTQPVGLHPFDRLQERLREHTVLLRMLLLGILAFLLSHSVLFGAISPFGAAFFAATRREEQPMVGLGAVLGYLLSFSLANNLRYVLAVLFLFTLQWALQGRWDRLLQHMPLLTAAALLLAFGIYWIFEGVTGHGVVLAAAEAVLAGGACFFFRQSLTLLPPREREEPAGQRELSCLVVSFALVAAALTPLQLFGLSVGRILAVTVILCAAREGGPFGAVAGTAAGTAVALAELRYGFLAGSYGVGGMVAGVFAPFGRLGSAAAFLLLNAVGVLFAQGGTIDLLPVYEVFLGGVGFLLTPAALPQWLRAEQEGEEIPGSAYKNLLLDRLAFSAEALREITAATREVAEALQARGAGSIDEVCSRAVQKVCGRCAARTRCWQEQYLDTMNVFNDMTAILRRGGSVHTDDLPAHFVAWCARTDLLRQAVQTEYAAYLSRSGLRKQAAQVRSVVTDQFEGMAMMLEDFSHGIAQLSRPNYRLARQVARKFRSMGAVPRCCHCFEDEYGRMTLELQLPPRKLARLEPEESVEQLSQLCGREFDRPAVLPGDRWTRLTYSERANFRVEHAAVQKNCGGARHSGDDYTVFTEPGGRSCAILSDGMGHGNAAAIDAGMTVNLLARLVRAGIGFDAALRVVNAAMLVKSGEESLSTVDAAAFDLFSGRLDLYKAGAAPTYLIRGGRSGSVGATSLPVGILSGVAFEKSTLSLQAGDTVLMVSDGVTAPGGEWIVPMLQGLREMPLQTLCEQIAATAAARRTDGHEDDITVIALRLQKALR